MAQRKSNSMYRSPEEVFRELRGTPTRIRLFYGDPQTGADWGEWSNVSGRVSMSTGRQPVYLLVNNARSLGGDAVSLGSVLRIITKGRGGIVELYRHPKYQIPNITVQGSEVLRDGETFMRGKTPEAAARLAAFMLGLRLSP